MNEYEAFCKRVEKISTAIQTIKESLTCRICLELFDEPVTIKCGHKFCRSCILSVTNNENSSCPLCNNKIQKRSIPKEGNAVFQTSVKQFENLIKAIQSDSGIDVSQPYNKAKSTKESSVEYSKPSTSKLEDTPSTSKESSSIFNKKSIKAKVANPVRNRLSLTKKKTDVKSPSQNSGNNTLHKYYLSNKSDPVPDQDVQSQEKVKSWLESCVSEDSDSIARDSIPGPSKPLKSSFTTDQIGSSPDQIYCSPRNNEIKKSDASPLPPSEESFDSKFKEIQMRIQEAENMAKKKKISLNINENNNVKTPSSVPATSQSDASNWRRVKQVGREMQVKTFKTLNVSIERCSPSVAIDDTVLYNSTNNDSKHISHVSEANNTSANKTPLKTKISLSLKSENNNLLKKSPQTIIEDYKYCSMDSTPSPKPECVTAFDVDEKQLNEIIGVEPSTSVSKTSEKSKISLKGLIGPNLNSNLDQTNSSKRKFSEKELSNEESLNCNSKNSAINLPNSSSKKNRLTLKSLKNSASLKNSSQSGISDKTSQKEKESSNNFSEGKSNSKLLGSLHDKANIIEQKIASTKSLCDNLVNKRSSSVASGYHVIFKKLGKICKKKKNVPFRYLGRLGKEKCLFFNHNSCRKPGIVMKSNVPVCIGYKSRIDDKNIANLNESHSKIILPTSDVPLNSSTKSSTVNNYEEVINVDEDVYMQGPGESDQQMEIDETLPPAKMIVKNNSNLEKSNSENQINLEKVEDFSSKSLKTKRKSLENEYYEKIPSQIAEHVPEPFRNTDEDNKAKSSETEIEKWERVPESSSKIDTVNNSSNFKQTKLSSAKKIRKNTNVNRILDDLISISSDDSEIKFHGTNSMQKVGKAKFNESYLESIKSDRESFTENEVLVTCGKGGGKNVEDSKHGYFSTSSSSFKTTGKKKRTHSESSTDDDDVVNIIDKWTNKGKISLDAEKKQATKKPKIFVDSEEMINKNASKVRHRTRYSFSSSSDDEEETFKENKHQQNSLVDDTPSKVKSQSTEVNGKNLTIMPTSMLSADLFESNEQSTQPIQSLKKQYSEIAVKITSAVDFDTQSDKENISERSPENITVIDTKQLKSRKSFASRNVDKDNRENNECNRTSDFNKSIKSVEETADEIESSQKGRKSTVSKNLDNGSKENNEQKRTSDFSRSIKTTEEHADEIEGSQKNQNKTVDNFEHETDPYFVRESLLNITQEQIACKNIEKDLFGVDLSKIHENHNEDLLDNDNFSTPRRKPTNSEENNEFDSDNIAPTPIAKRRHTLHFRSSQSSPISEIHASIMSSPDRKMSLIPAITPMKNTRSYPLCHSTPMISMGSPENRVHSQIENMKIVCTSLTLENTKLVQKFADRFDAQLKSNFDVDVTHVVVKVDPQTKAGPKTFKYIQGIAFKKYVVSFEWITDCLAKNELLDANDEKYDVLDPDVLESGCKKSRLSSQRLFKDFAFCCLEPFVKVSLSEFEELLTYNGAVIVSSIREFHFHKDKFKVIIVGSEDLNDEGIAILTKAEAAAVYFEWVVDSLSQFQILSLPSYLCETTVGKVRSLGFPPELLVEDETLEEDDDDN